MEWYEELKQNETWMIKKLVFVDLGETCPICNANNIMDWCIDRMKDTIMQKWNKMDKVKLGFDNFPYLIISYLDNMNDQIIQIIYVKGN